LLSIELSQSQGFTFFFLISTFNIGYVRCNSAAQPAVYCPLWAFRPRGFVPGDVSPSLSLTPQNAYNMLATSTTNKVNYQTSPADVGYYNSPPLRSPTTLSARGEQKN